MQTPAAVMDERLHAAHSRKEEEEGDVAVRTVPIVMMMKGKGMWWWWGKGRGGDLSPVMLLRLHLSS